MKGISVQHPELKHHYTVRFWAVPDGSWTMQEKRVESLFFYAIHCSVIVKLYWFIALANKDSLCQKILRVKKSGQNSHNATTDKIPVYKPTNWHEMMLHTLAYTINAYTSPWGCTLYCTFSISTIFSENSTSAMKNLFFVACSCLHAFGIVLVKMGMFGLVVAFYVTTPHYGHCFIANQAHSITSAHSL